MRALVLLTLLAACGPVEYDAQWVKGACVRSHRETRVSMTSCGPSMGLDGQMHMDCQAGRMRYVTDTVCDEHAPPVCRPGSDGVADCAQPETKPTEG